MSGLDLEKLIDKVNSVQINYDANINYIFSLCCRDNEKYCDYSSEITKNITTSDLLKVGLLLKNKAEDEYVKTFIYSNRLVDFVFNAKDQYNEEEEDIY